MSKTETFSDSIYLAGINEYDKDALMQISTVVWQVYHWLVQESSETELFKHLSDHILGDRNLGNTKSMRVIFFFKIFKIYFRFQKLRKKLRKSFVFLR